LPASLKVYTMQCKGKVIALCQCSYFVSVEAEQVYNPAAAC